MRKKDKNFYLNWVTENFLITSDEANQLPKEVLELDMEEDDELILEMVYLAYLLQQRKARGVKYQLSIPAKELEKAISIGYQRFILHLGFFELIQKGFLILEEPIHLFTFGMDTDFLIKHFERYLESIPEKD